MPPADGQPRPAAISAGPPTPCRRSDGPAGYLSSPGSSPYAGATAENAPATFLPPAGHARPELCRLPPSPPVAGPTPYSPVARPLPRTAPTTSAPSAAPSRLDTLKHASYTTCLSRFASAPGVGPPVGAFTLRQPAVRLPPEPVRSGGLRQFSGSARRLAARLCRVAAQPHGRLIVPPLARGSTPHPAAGPVYSLRGGSPPHRCVRRVRCTRRSDGPLGPAVAARWGAGGAAGHGLNTLQRDHGQGEIRAHQAARERGHDRAR
jgi:hypothetical protein